MGNNIQKLGEVLSGRMKKTAGAAVQTTIELGTINSNLSLTTDSLRAPIPKGDYMVNLTLASNTYKTSKSSVELTADFTIEIEGNKQDINEKIKGGEHDHMLPSVFRGLKPGDRVLVAWCGFEPVVIAILVSS